MKDGWKKRALRFPTILGLDNKQVPVGEAES